MDERLTLISQMVKPCRYAADIGTDHGYLICALVGQGIAQRGIAADINPQPLEKAVRQIAACGLQEHIHTLCTDGLCGIGEQVDAVILAGMGGELIARILDDWRYSRRADVSFYLQPMTKAERLREYLYQAGFSIQQERCCVAAHRPYSVMEVIFTGQAKEATPLELWLGAIDPAAGAGEQAYCSRLRAKLERKQNGLQQAATPKAELDYWRTLCKELQERCNDTIQKV
ncbi:MAG: class I SAM-dependent methyltransferase [Angelakisella sp.]